MKRNNFRALSLAMLPVVKTFAVFFVLCLIFSATYGQSKGAGGSVKDTLRPKMDTLKTAIVTATLRPRVKGDTLEYNVERVRLPPNALVEELLRRLPGLQVDPDGTITYNGEKIQHLLVDGQDIFGSDPTMVTRNFDAGKIARIQILDRKSDQAIFTDIDDGSRTKTLNLVMKESAKDGYFGRIQAGGNIQGYYSASAALAGFRDKEQVTAMGLASNTGVLGFVGGNGAGTSISFLNGNTDALGASAGAGVPRFTAVALHYFNSWNGSQEDLNSNYQYSHYVSQPVTVSQSLQTQPDSIYSQHQQNRSSNGQDQHWLYAIYDMSPSLWSAVKLTFHASNSEGANNFASIGSSSFNDMLVNSSLRSIDDNVKRLNVGGEVAWRTKIRGRADQMLSASLTATQINNSTAGYLFSLNRFYTNGGLVQSADTIDQRKQISDHFLNLGGAVNYTQPLWKAALLGLSYKVSHAGDDPVQSTFNKGDGKYLTLVDSLSSRLMTETVSQYATVTIQGQMNNLKYTLGSDFVGYEYRQHDLITDSTRRLHYWNPAPRAMISYNPSSITRFEFYYFASTQPPTIAQLAPTLNNADPLHITIGNPGLKPGFTQDFKLSFNYFRNILFTIYWHMAIVGNAISTKTTTDSLGRQVSQPVDVNGGRASEVAWSLNRKIAGFDAGLYGKGSLLRSMNFVNSLLSRNDVFSGGGGLSLNRYVPEKYGLQLKTNFTYFDQVSSVNTAAPVRYWTQSHQGSVVIYLIPHFEIGTSAVYTWQEKTIAFASNTSVLLWNGYIARNFLGNKLVAKFQFNNLLNANAGISRTNSGNVNTQSATNILGRYWMVSAVWHFDRKFRK